MSCPEVYNIVMLRKWDKVYITNLRSTKSSIYYSKNFAILSDKMASLVTIRCL
jgi:hypothetical protein